MKKGQFQIVGIQKREKDGKTSWILHGITPFEDWEVTNSVGEKVISEWTNRVDCTVLKPGDIVEFQYAKGFQGAAVLSNIRIVEKAK